MTGTGAAAVTGRPHAQWPKTTVRVTFGAVWLIDAILNWLPGFRPGTDALHEGAGGQPGWLKPWFNFWINLQKPRATFFAYLVAVVETLIALALIAGFARKLTYAAAIVFSLLIWSTAEGFGGPYTSGASDIGTAVIYALVFAALLIFSYYQGTPRLSVDYYLDKRISWWHRIADVGPGHHVFGSSKRPTPARPPTPPSERLADDGAPAQSSEMGTGSVVPPRRNAGGTTAA